MKIAGLSGSSFLSLFFVLGLISSGGFQWVFSDYSWPIIGSYVIGNGYSESLRVVPFEGKTFGADVYGFDPRAILEPGPHNQKLQQLLREELKRHLVLVFHDVADKFTPETQVEFTKQVYGPVYADLSGPPKYIFKGKHQSTDQEGAKKAFQAGKKMDAFAATMTKYNKADALLTKVITEPENDAVAFGEGFHTDVTFKRDPPYAAVLIARQLPRVGLGNTKFLDMRVAYETLPAKVKEQISNMYGNHTDKDVNWSLHPVTVRDPFSQRDSLFVNRHFTRSIFDHSEDVSLEFLLDHIADLEANYPQASLNITWEPGK